MPVKKPLSPFEKKLNAWVAEHMTRVPFIQKIFFVDHLKTMVHAGLSLVESLVVLEKETTNKKLKQTIHEIKKSVEQGTQLSDVLAEYPQIFPSMYVKMIHAGEVGGQLEEALEHVVDQMKRSRELTSSIRGAMIYPGVIITAMGGIGIMMATMVLPKLVELFEEFDSELPLPTRVLIAVTNIMSNPLYLTLIVGGTIAMIVGFITLMRKSAPFKKIIHTMVLKLPIVGPIIKQINLAKFSLTLSSLLSSTVQIVDAVNISADTCTNVLYRESLHEAGEKLQTGEQLSVVLATHESLFPPMVTEMIMVGERSGEINSLLIELAKFYSNEVQKVMENFTKIIEPVIIILIGLVVAGLAVAVIMPMYSLVQNF